MDDGWNIEELEEKSRLVRTDILRCLAEAGSGHTGGSLGLADLFVSLYFNILNHKPGVPDWEGRDRLILSIGHVAPVLYATLAHAGYFPKDELLTLRRLGSRLQGHPGREHGLPGLELSAGSLGQGLPVAVGLALAAKADKKPWRVYSVHGDGEMQEGSIWEAAMSAAHYKLDNLTAYIDRNGVQIDGRTADVMEIEPLADKWRAFGWEVFECDGHDHRRIIETTQNARRIRSKPSVIILRTIMGKGVRSIENDYRWHGKAPSKEELERFLRELA
ncbi:MAG: transketolase [Bacteroidales bacterium]|jgi:transketolase|nr:transketolase [Bacteroidales bacterium]